MGKVLFICRENIGRSQVASEYCKQLYDHHQVYSAGVIVDFPGQKLQDNEYAANVLRIMREEGLEIGDSVRTPLNEIIDDLPSFDRIIFMAEINLLPKQFMNVYNIEVWPIPDMKDLNIPETRHIIHGIRDKVRQMEGSLESDSDAQTFGLSRALI